MLKRIFLNAVSGKEKEESQIILAEGYIKVTIIKRRLAIFI